VHRPRGRTAHRLPLNLEAIYDGFQQFRLFSCKKIYIICARDARPVSTAAAN
jgi:hypothetical protein